MSHDILILSIRQDPFGEHDYGPPDQAQRIIRGDQTVRSIPVIARVPAIAITCE